MVGADTGIAELPGDRTPVWLRCLLFECDGSLRISPPSLESIMPTLRKDFAIAFMIARSGTLPPAERKPAAKDLVIVHGALVDGSGWRAVYDILTKDGFHVTIVQEPLTSLAEDVDATKRVIDQQTGPVVLVGHSYGGSGVTEAGTDPQGRAPRYIDAPHPGT